jgi:hypothetical protein
MTRNRPFAPRALLSAGFALTLATLLPACATGTPSYPDEKFQHAISETFEESPGLVVDLVDETVDTLRLQIVQRVLTAIDGRFEVRTAMGEEYRVVVEGLKTNRTRIEIDMPSRRNLGQAQLIMTEIRSRIRGVMREKTEEQKGEDSESDEAES